MPELPEVETIVRNLRPVMSGRTIKQFTFFRSDLRNAMPIAALHSNLTGQIIDGILRRSKYIIMRTNGGSAIIHLGMTGNLLVRGSGTPELPHTHFIISHFQAPDGNVEYLHYVDPRRFGSLGFASADLPLEEYKELAELGPEPLAKDFDLGTYLWRRSRGRSTAIKPFLMDAGVVVGVGNIYASESLFRAHIRPTRRASSLSRASYQALATCIRSTLDAAIVAGGTTFRDFQHADGKPGYFRVKLAVYDRAGEPCLACGSSIVTIRQAGRSTFYCPKCQK